MKRKILIAASNLNCGGKERSLVSLLQLIDYEKFEVDLLLTNAYIDGEFFTKYVPEKVKLVYLPEKYKWLFIPRNNYYSLVKHSIGYNLNFFKLIFYTIKGLVLRNMVSTRQRLWEACSKYMPELYDKYDVAIDYTGGHKQLILDKVSAKTKITWIHSDYKVYRRDKSLDRNDYRRIDSIVTVSKTTYDIFVTEFPEYKEKTYIIPNISNKSKIRDMSSEKVEFDNDYLGIRIIDITRLDPNKGIDIAIDACKKLIDEGYDIKWYILGDGPERRNLEELIRRNNLEKKFILLGLQANPYPFIRIADLVVHCSLFEGKSVAIDEAMLLAKPIVLTNYPTAKDQVENGVNGLICDISVDGVSNAVKLLIDNDKLKENLVMNLQDFDISPKDSIDQFYKIIM